MNGRQSRDISSTIYSPTPSNTPAGGVNVARGSSMARSTRQYQRQRQRPGIPSRRVSISSIRSIASRHPSTACRVAVSDSPSAAGSPALGSDLTLGDAQARVGLCVDVARWTRAQVFIDPADTASMAGPFLVLLLYVRSRSAGRWDTGAKRSMYSVTPALLGA